MIQLEPQEHRDRRINPRVTATIGASVDFVNPVTNRAERARAIVTTLGAKGISIHTSAPLARAQYIDIYLQVPESELPLRLSGTVRWSIVDGKQNYFHGIKLD